DATVAFAVVAPRVIAPAVLFAAVVAPAVFFLALFLLPTVFFFDRGAFLAVLESPERHFLGDFLAFADDHHLDFLADRRVGYDARQVAHLLDVAAVELDDHVARLDAGGLGRTLVVDAGDQGATRRIDAEAFRDLGVDLLDAHAEPAAPHFFELAQLFDHRHHGLRRHRKSDADRAAGRRNDGGVHADHLAREVEQRA